MVMGELAQATDVVVIGAGPGGYVAAIRAAQLGKDVTLIDKAEVGGICLNHGCIPSKAIIHVSNLFSTLQDAKQMGITTGKVSVKTDALKKWKHSVVTKLTGGIKTLLDSYNITLIQGEAHFESSRKIRVTTTKGARTLQFSHAIIATGSSPIELKGFAFDGKKVWGSRDALKLESIPKRLLIIGGGYIGLELGCVYQKLGSQVTIVQRGPRLCPFIPEDAVRVVQKRMTELGVKFLLDSTATKLSKTKTVSVTVNQSGKTKNVTCDAVLLAVGRRPNTAGLGLEHTRVELDEHGFIKVDEQRRTNEPHLFAIGDVVGQPMLAHKASQEGKVAAEAICGKASAFDNVVPAVMFTDPEIALVGLDEQQAKDAGHELAIGSFPFSASGRAATLNTSTGFIKLVCDAKNHLLLGAQIVGPHASDLIGELALAIEMGATADDLMLTIHVHPTLGEAIQEAAADVLSQSIHHLKKK